MSNFISDAATLQPPVFYTLSPHILAQDAAVLARQLQFESALAATARSKVKAAELKRFVDYFAQRHIFLDVRTTTDRHVRTFLIAREMASGITVVHTPGCAQVWFYVLNH